MDFIDYTHIADLYDAYVQTDLDISFFVNEAKQTTGDVLELMAGTGRVSLALAEAGVRLTSVDISADMLTVLREKAAGRGLTIDTHEMDICKLDLGKQYDLIFIPFNSFSELQSSSDQKQALRKIYEHLADNGRFICTLHNPPIRLQSVQNGQLQFWGQHPLANGGSLVFWAVQNYDADDQSVDMIEFFEEYDRNGIMQKKRKLDIRFNLLQRQGFENLARSAGFQTMQVYGDYTYSEFEEDQSPFMIWILEK